MSATLVQPYLFFGGQCEEAIEFYRKTIGAQVVMLMRFNESPQAPPPGTLAPGFENKVMHSSFKVGNTTILASDGCEPGMAYTGFSLALSVPNVAEAESAFAALSEGGKVTMPLAKTFWSPGYGMLTDRFGIAWMVMATA